MQTIKLNLKPEEDSMYRVIVETDNVETQNQMINKQQFSNFIKKNVDSEEMPTLRKIIKKFRCNSITFKRE